jgi:transposase
MSTATHRRTTAHTRSLVVAAHNQGRTYDQISDKYDVPKSTVKGIIDRHYGALPTQSHAIHPRRVKAYTCAKCKAAGRTAQTIYFPCVLCAAGGTG